jgi:hypothetical protein
MALAANVEAKIFSEFKSQAPVSLTGVWQTVISAGGPATQDAATITNATTQITAATRSIFSRKGAGTILLIRLGYDDGLTSITNPIIKVFGRTGSDAWMVLKDVSGNLTLTLTTALSTDATDGTLLYTAADVATSSIDCLGCDEILIGVQTALAGTGTVSNSIIQVKAL